MNKHILLTKFQENTLNYARALESQTAIDLSIYIYGPAGSGKKTISKIIFQQLDIEYHNTHFISQNSFENQLLDCFIALNNSPEIKGVIISGIHILDENQLAKLASLSENRHITLQSKTYILQKDIFLIIIHDHNKFNDIKYANMHYCYKNNFELPLSFSELELCQIIRSMCLVYHGVFVFISSKLLDYISNFLYEIDNGLHYLNQIISRIDSTKLITRVLEFETFYDIAIQDIHSISQRCIYRGRRLDSSNINVYLSQFPSNYLDCAVILLQNIFTKYFITSRSYYESIETALSQITTKNKISFLKFEYAGKSSLRVAHQFKNQGNLSTTADCDINDALSIDRLPENCSIIIIDDFSGSGKTLLNVISSQTVKYASEKNIEIYIVILFSYLMSARNIKLSADKLNLNIKIIIGFIFDEPDKCFSANSSILSERMQSKCKELCDLMAQKYYPRINKKHKYGFNGTGSLIVFEDTVPNNTLPFVWFTNSELIPLYPAAGLIE